MHSSLEQSLPLKHLNHYETAVELLDGFAGPVGVDRIADCSPTETVHVEAFEPVLTAVVVVVAAIAGAAVTAVTAAVAASAGVSETGGIAGVESLVTGVAVAGEGFRMWMVLTFEGFGFLTSVHAAFAAGYAKSKGIGEAAAVAAVAAVGWCHNQIARGRETFFAANLRRTAVAADNGADQGRRP